MKVSFERMSTINKLNLIKSNDENILNKRKKSLQVKFTHIEKY
jgi:hypothetical protein